MSPTPALPPSLPKAKRPASQRTERVIAESVTTTVDDPRFADMETRLSGQFTNEVRNLETHLSEWQGTQVAAYEQVMRTVGTLTTAVTNLTTQVGQLVTDRTADAAFIATKRQEDADKAHQAELEAVAAQTRAAMVLEQQAIKATEDQAAADKAQKESARQKGKVDKRNRLYYTLITSDVGTIAALAVYLVTGTGDQTGTSRVLAAVLMGVLGVAAIVLALLAKPEITI